MLEKLEKWLLDHGLPQEVIDKVAALEGHAKEIAWMVIMDGKEAAIKFIEEEYAKVVAAIKANS